MNPTSRSEFNRMEMAVPIFDEVCNNCHQEVNDYAELNHHICSGGNVGDAVSKVVCLDCLDEVIAYKSRCRNVSDMTGELPGVESARIRRYVKKYLKAN